MTFRRACMVSLAVAALAACDGEEKEPIKIGLLTPKTGPIFTLGERFEEVASLAVERINEKGGVDGHPLELVVRDTQLTAMLVPGLFNELVNEGVVGIIGPAASGEVEAAYPLARDLKIPMISPSSTATSLIDVMDDGYLFRNVPNDAIQAEIAAYYLRGGGGQIPNAPTAARATVLAEETAYGTELAEAFKTAFEARGGHVNPPVYFPKSVFEDADPLNPEPPAEKVTRVTEYITQLLNPDPLPEGFMEPEYVILIALGKEGRYMAAAWAQSGLRPDVKWLLVDGSRTGDFLNPDPDLDGDIPLPPELLNAVGTAATYPVLGDAYRELADAYMEKYNQNISRQLYVPNVWDGVYLLATGLLYQSVNSPGEPFGGAGLRDALFDISKQPGSLLDSSQWREITAAIKNGRQVDYDGAGGPSDFDNCGESISPYEIWSIAQPAAGGDLEFKQESFLEAKDVQELTGFDPTAGGVCSTPASALR